VKLEGAPTYNGQPLTKRAKRQVGFVLQARPARRRCVRPDREAREARGKQGRQGWGCREAPGVGSSVRGHCRHGFPAHLSFVDLGWRGRAPPGSRDTRRTPRRTLPPRIPDASAGVPASRLG